MTEVSLVVVVTEPLLSHRRVVWLHAKEVTAPKCFSVAAHRPCLPSASTLRVHWLSGRVAVFKVILQTGFLRE